MENLPIKESDLATFAGLALVIPMLVGALKKLWPAWVKGKEAHLALISTLAIGIATKLTVPGAFGGVGWVTLILGLIFTAVGSMVVHDQVINRVIHKPNPNATKPGGQG